MFLISRNKDKYVLVWKEGKSFEASGRARGWKRLFRCIDRTGRERERAHCCLASWQHAFGPLYSHDSCNRALHPISRYRMQHATPAPAHVPVPCATSGCEHIVHRPCALSHCLSRLCSL